jgi:hypothetical protein
MLAYNPNCWLMLFNRAAAAPITPATAIVCDSGTLLADVEIQEHSRGEGKISADLRSLATGGRTISTLGSVRDNLIDTGGGDLILLLSVDAGIGNDVAESVEAQAAKAPRAIQRINL